MSLINFLLFAEHEDAHVLTVDLNINKLKGIHFDEDTGFEIRHITLKLTEYKIGGLHLPQEGYVSSELLGTYEHNTTYPTTFDPELLHEVTLLVCPDGYIQARVEELSRQRDTEWYSEWLHLDKLS